MYTVAVSGQECTDTVTVGSLSYGSNIVPLYQTFILAGYTVPCSGAVVAWEYCYLNSDSTSMSHAVTFYPGIWRINGTMSGNTDYTLVQSNTVTYDPSVHDPTSFFLAGFSTFQIQISLLHQQDQLWDCILILYHCYYILTLTVQ